MRKLTLSILVLCLWSGSAAAATLGPSAALAGRWYGGAYADDTTGRFTRCIMSAGFENGITVYFGVNRALGFEIGFSNPQWVFKPGEQAIMNYQIDTFPMRATTGRAIAANTATMDLEATRQVFVEFQKGYVLRVQAGGQVFSFSLADTYVGLSKLMQCAGRVLDHEAGDDSNLLSAWSSPEAPDVATQVQQRLDAQAFVVELLAAANIPGFRLVPREQIPPVLANRDVVWSGNDLIGMLSIIKAGIPADQIAKVVAEKDAKSCKGTFSSGAKALPGVAAEIKSFFSMCTGGPEPTFVQYAAVPRADGATYLMFHIEVPVPANAPSSNLPGSNLLAGDGSAPRILSATEASARMLAAVKGR